MQYELWQISRFGLGEPLQPLVLIDKKQRIRSFYDGTDSLEINKLIQDIPLLLND